MNDIVKIEDKELISVMQNSLYPGAKEESVQMVLSYCHAAGLDPLQKPVHIVPMSVRNEKGGYTFKDVIMPGIGLYRIQASRTGTLAGVSAPIFGDMVTQTFTDKNNKPVDVSYPEYCTVTVTKLVEGIMCEFTAQEFWLENYAVQKSTCDAPNAMWAKRARGQLAKCAEAQALRKAFPEIGSQPTYEEMDGKHIEQSYIEAEIIEDKSYPEDEFKANFKTWQSYISSGKVTAKDMIAKIESKGTLTDDMKKKITNIKVKK